MLSIGCAEMNKSSDSSLQISKEKSRVNLNNNKIQKSSGEVSNQEQTLSSNDGLDSGKTSSKSTLNNVFFFKNNITQVSYTVTYAFEDNMPVDDNIKLYVNEVANLKQGRLYELKIDNIQDVPRERLILGYFYVQKDKIYKMELTEESLKNLKSNNVIPKESIVVCQEKALKDNLKKDKSGWHHYIDVDGDKRIYHAYNDLTTTGYYESFTWEKGRGLISYYSGFGAESDSINLQVKVD